jgi:DNA-binding MarR family transcriptional regulator
LEAATGLQRSAQVILQRLSQDEPMTTTQLAAALGIDRSTLSRQLQPLKEEDLVSAVHVGGGRRTELTLTSSGRERAMDIDRVVMDQYAAALHQLSPEKVHQLASLLSEFREALTAIVKH